MSRRPNRSTVRSTRFLMSSSKRTSAWMNAACAPAPCSSRARDWPGSGWRPDRTTRAPAVATRRAVARPIPVRAPVTSTTGWSDIADGAFLVMVARTGNDMAGGWSGHGQVAGLFLVGAAGGGAPRRADAEHDDGADGGGDHDDPPGCVEPGDSPGHGGVPEDHHGERGGQDGSELAGGGVDGAAGAAFLWWQVDRGGLDDRRHGEPEAGAEDEPAGHHRAGVAVPLVQAEGDQRLPAGHQDEPGGGDPPGPEPGVELLAGPGGEADHGRAGGDGQAGLHRRPVPGVL